MNVRTYVCSGFVIVYSDVFNDVIDDDDVGKD